MLWVVASLLFGNTLLMFLLDSGRKHVDAGRLSAIAYWYSEHGISIQYVLLAMLVVIFVIFRKRVHYVRRK
jgi:hypothetical protein